MTVATLETQQIQNKSSITKEEAEQIAVEILRLEAALKQMKDKLKDYVDKNGELVAGNKVWGYQESITLKMTGEQKRKVAEVMAVDGIKVWDHVSISASTLLELGWGKDSLSQFGEVKVNKRFSSRALK